MPQRSSRRARRRVPGRRSAGRPRPAVPQEQDRRAVRQERRQAARCRRAQGGARVAGDQRRRPRRIRWTRAAGGRGPGPTAVLADAAAVGGRAAAWSPARRVARSSRPTSAPTRRDRSTTRHAAHALPRVRERRLGAGARRLQQHRRRSARDRDRRRHDLQGRRRALPRHVVVHDGARRARSGRSTCRSTSSTRSRRSAAIAR